MELTRRGQELVALPKALMARGEAGGSGRTRAGRRDIL